MERTIWNVRIGGQDKIRGALRTPLNVTYFRKKAQS